MAARNVLVLRLNPLDATSVHVKLSDYGLARQGQGDGGAYYSSGSGPGVDPLPVRWMAPETLTKNRFSELSDVWAFAVLVWELYAEGRLPYFAVKSDEELIDRVCSRNGLRLARPEGCPEVVYAVMLRCWEGVPANRPSFQQLQGLLVQTLVALGAAQGASGALQRLQETAEDAVHGAQEAAKAAAGAEAAARELRR